VKREGRKSREMATQPAVGHEKWQMVLCRRHSPPMAGKGRYANVLLLISLSLLSFLVMARL
jgi:hypothetical protein